MRRRDFLLAAAILAPTLRSARAQSVAKRRIAAVNLKAAKSLGLDIPSALVAQADTVIE